MNILIITSEIGRGQGGLALTCGQLDNTLKEMGNSVDIEVSLNPKLESYFVLDGGYDPKLGSKIRIKYYIDEIVRKYKKKELDLIIAYGAGKNSYIAGIIAKLIEVPYIVVLCGSDVNISAGDIENYLYNDVSLKSASKIVGLSQELIENAKLFNHNKEIFEVIPNIYEFDLEKFKKRDLKKLVVEKPIIFGTGSAYLNEKKGIGNLLLVFSKYLKKFNRNDKIYFYGKIDRDIKERYEEIVKSQGIDSNVEFFDYLAREEYLKKMNEVDIYLQFSPYEGCCNAIAEAIIEKKYTIISKTGYFGEILSERFPNTVIETLEVDKASDRLWEIINYLKENDIRENIFSYLSDEMNRNIICNKWRKVLEEVVMRKKIPNIVMFHDVNIAYTGVDYSKYGFEKLMELIDEKGYKLCSYDQYLREENKENLIICTFDDGYENVYINAYPIMKKFGFTATVFVCPDHIGEFNYWNHRDEMLRKHMDLKMLRELKEAGWEIGSHGMGHYNMLRLSETELEHSLVNSKKILEKEFGKIKSFCYPYGIYNPYIRGLAGKYYDVAFAVDNGGTDFEMDRFQLTRVVPEKLKKMLERL